MYAVQVQCEPCGRWCHAECSGLMIDENETESDGYTCVPCSMPEEGSETWAKKADAAAMREEERLRKALLGENVFAVETLLARR